MKIVLWFLMLVFAMPSIASKNPSFWMEPANRTNCHQLKNNVDRFIDLSKTVTRNPRGEDDGMRFAANIGSAVAAYLGNDKFDLQDFKRYMLEAAELKAFSQAYYNPRVGGPSPFYVQSNILRQIALGLLILKKHNLLSDQEHERIVDWGNSIAARQFAGASGMGSNDSIAAVGVAKMAWGSVTQQENLVTTGYANFLDALPYIFKFYGAPKLDWDHVGPEFSGLTADTLYNINLSHLIEGAIIAKNLGYASFELQFDGKKMTDVVSWWTQRLADGVNDFQGYKVNSNNWHVGWIPLYLSQYPNSNLRPLFSKILYRSNYRDPAYYPVKKGVPQFRAISLGGPVDCLFGYSWPGT